MKKAALVAGPGAGVVDLEFRASTNDGCFVHGHEGAEELDLGIGAGLDGLGHGVEKILTAIGIDGVISGMGGDGDSFGFDTFRVACGEGEENSVTERNDGFFHRLLFVMAVGDFAAGFKQIGFESLRKEGERHDLILNAEEATLVGGTGKFAGVMFGPVIKAEGGDHLFRGGHVMKDGDRIKATGKKDHHLHGKKGL